MKRKTGNIEDLDIRIEKLTAHEAQAVLGGGEPGGASGCSTSQCGCCCEKPGGDSGGSTDQCACCCEQDP